MAKPEEQKQQEIEPIAPSGAGVIAPRSIVTEMRDSYLDYAMSVIVARALPDVRDGLKPVHRRILYAMWQMGLKHTAKFRKSAAITGEVLGKYHPHGDTAVYDAMVRMAQDFSFRHPLVHGQGNMGCFTKDTKIKLTDGRDLSFEELAEEYNEGKKNYTFTVNSNGRIAIAEIKHPRMTIPNAELLQVTLDNGAKIRCTPNHLFMLRDGSYKEAQNLQAGESLMPLYERVSTNEDRLKREGYALVYQNALHEWVPVHHLADNYNLTRHIYKKENGRVRHHKDFNKQNNNPDNIARVHWGEHWKIHYEQASNQHKNPEYRAKLAAGRNAYWSNPETKAYRSQKLSDRNRLAWQNPLYREKMRGTLSRVNKEYIQKHPERRLEYAITGSQNMKRMWQDPKYRALFHEKIVAANKKRVTNNTGKLKFLTICRAVLGKYRQISKEYYEDLRNQLYGYGCATTWETGIKKYYQNNPDLVLHELNKNHKVLGIIPLSSREDVYDLTIDDSHNFALSAGVFVHNSLDGDNAAAMRYTEAKLMPLAEELLKDIERNTVDFVPNYDGVHHEPTVLPASFPNLLVNGTVGIAVGMATNIPPHNLGELIDATVHIIDNPDAAVIDLLEYVQGPDFPTGGIIYSKKDIEAAYSTGRGGITVRAETEIVEDKSGFRIIVTEIPYQVNKASLVEKIADLVKDKKIEDIKDLRDESSKGKVRIVIELKKDAYPRKVLNNLFKMTQLQETFHFNTLALVDGIQPRVLNLKMMLEEFIKHREVVVKRRTEFDLDKAKARAHILEGLKKAIDKIDAVIATIKKSKDRDQAKVNLMDKFRFTEPQAVAILEMRLQNLANLERQKVDDELKEKLALIKELESLLASRKKMLGIIKDELLEIKKNYANERRTKVVARGVKDFSIEDLVPNEQVIVMMTKDGYLKRLPPDTFKVQARGGKGVIGVTTKEEDEVEFLQSTNTHDDLLFFTNRGRVFQLKAYDIPQASRTSKGQAAVNFLQLAPNEKVTALLTLTALSDYKFLVMTTEKGLVKKTAIEDYANVRRSGLIAIRLKDGDNLQWIRPSTGNDDVMIVTAKGQAIRFKEKLARPMGRNAAGVRGIRLKNGERVVGMDVVTAEGKKDNDLYEVFVMSEFGLGKRTALAEYKVQNRGGSGIKTMNITAKTGPLVNMEITEKKTEQEILVISTKGQVIRVPFGSVPSLGRATQGVRIMRFKEAGDSVASVTLL